MKHVLASVQKLKKEKKERKNEKKERKNGRKKKERKKKETRPGNKVRGSYHLCKRHT